jgi:hypothetical protein
MHLVQVDVEEAVARDYIPSQQVWIEYAADIKISLVVIRVLLSPAQQPTMDPLWYVHASCTSIPSERRRLMT